MLAYYSYILVIIGKIGSLSAARCRALDFLPIVIIANKSLVYLKIIVKSAISFWTFDIFWHIASACETGIAYL